MCLKPKVFVTTCPASCHLRGWAPSSSNPGWRECNCPRRSGQPGWSRCPEIPKCLASQKQICSISKSWLMVIKSSLVQAKHSKPSPNAAVTTSLLNRTLLSLNWPPSNSPTTGSFCTKGQLNHFWLWAAFLILNLFQMKIYLLSFYATCM